MIFNTPYVSYLLHSFWQLGLFACFTVVRIHTVFTMCFMTLLNYRYVCLICKFLDPISALCHKFQYSLYSNTVIYSDILSAMNATTVLFFSWKIIIEHRASLEFASVIHSHPWAKGVLPPGTIWLCQIDILLGGVLLASSG